MIRYIGITRAAQKKRLYVLNVFTRKISISERNGMCRVRTIGAYYAVVSNMQT